MLVEKIVRELMEWLIYRRHVKYYLFEVGMIQMSEINDLGVNII